VSAPPPELFYDWNRRGTGARALRVSFDDETLRDGLQSPSVANPSLADKLRFIHLVARLGIGSADVGMPGAGGRAGSDAEALCREVAEARLPLRPNCAARTVESDILPILEIAQRSGQAVEVAMFVGSSAIRRDVEGWSLDELLRRVDVCVGLARRHGAPVTFVTEDTTRSHPDDLRALYLAAVRAGATRVCVADTAGHATPLTVLRVVRFVRATLRDSGADVGLDWHGHNDRGMAVANALTAAWAGAERLHATALGVGERIGNPPMEQLLLNAALEGWAEPRLELLGEYVSLAAGMLGVAVPAGAPVVGRDAFRTSTGVHASAILKARRRGDRRIEDLVYSAVPASLVGREQVIEVGPLSGTANVRCWLADHGYADDRATVERILAAAKRADRTLSDEQLHALAGGRDANRVGSRGPGDRSGA
jgi:2-isopropylmalate synthase